MSLEPEPVQRLSSSSSIATELARLSLDLSGGGRSVVRPGTLLDEYERLAIEAQLSRAVLRRSYSEPSPSRTAALQEEEEEIAAPVVRHAENVERGQGQPATCEPRARRFWLLEALKRVWCWLGLGLGLGGAWGGHGRNGEQAMPVPQPPEPAPVPPRLPSLASS